MSRRVNYNADEINEEEEEEDDEEEDDHEKSEKKRRELFGGCSYKRVKKGVNKRFSQFHTRIKRLSSSSSLIKLKSDTIVDDSSSSGSVKGKKKRGKFDCCLCFSKPQTLENCVDDCELGDPNVDYNSLRVLIENNDFYSKECNTLFDD